MNKAVFIDKDGTLIPDVPYNVDPALIKLSPDSIQGLRTLAQNGYLLVIISNQSGVALGYFREEALGPVKEKIVELLKEEGLTLDGFFYCPHHPEGDVAEYRKECACRKPLPGLILQACAEMQIDPAASWMVGDILHDVEAGNRAGCRSILINNGNETEWLRGEIRNPDCIVTTIDEAAIIISESEVVNAG